MAKYTHQAKATKAFGVEFRSKLEAQWAYEFTNIGGPFSNWSYADSSWHDFKLDDNKHVEIKPLGYGFMLDALSRAWGYKGQWLDDTMVFLLGNPNEAFVVIATVLECGNCARLYVSEYKKDDSRQRENTNFSFAWNESEGIYGIWCEHGSFKEFKNGCK